MGEHPGGTGARRYDVVVVGAGFNGLYQLWRLRGDGFSVRLVEASGGLGGVWQSNRYPGARVDSHVPNYEYSLEQVWRDWTWTERFPGRDELVAYFDHVDRVLDLSPDIDLRTRITAARYDTDTRRWAVTAVTPEGPVAYDCRYLVMCTGFGSKPYVPDLDGLDDFAGPAHHTAQWPEDGVSFAGRRVGVIGTGASGVQVVQEAARDARHLTVFQRSPVTALPMEQRRLDPDEQAAAKATYPEIFRARNAPPGSFADVARIDIGALEVSDDERRRVFEEAWAKGGFHFWVGTFRDILLDEKANRTAYDFWRDKVRARVDDPVTARLLAPDEPPYPFGTKRPSLEQGYYECFNQPNVDLVDLRAEPIERVLPTGLRLAAGDGAGREIDLDVLVLATGFDANTGGLTAIDLRAPDGRSLAEVWADGVDTHLGMAVPGFPNLLMLYGPQSPTAFCNGPVCAELQGDWVADLLGHLRERGLTEIDSSPDAARSWSDHLAEFADSTLFGRADSWYMGANIPGKRRQLLNYPSSDAYLARLARCAANDYEGFVLR
ncbi:MAG: NAD(P)/FAD-dependent oxidoreductase [Actinomycetota bacterium]|nr:NAD(P)/FAD-dependent oxidoreductase [Actinomycetota bacterium]